MFREHAIPSRHVQEPCYHCLVDPSGCSAAGVPSRTVSYWNEWDLLASYTVSTSFGKTTLVAGVNNLFNTPPPVIYSAFWPTSDPTAYDFVGRFVYGRAVHRF